MIEFIKKERRDERKWMLIPKVQYYTKTDQMGIVHHSNYIRWFEEARTDFMKSLGTGYAEDGKARSCSVRFLAVDATYLRMARFGDTVSIKTKITSYNGIKLSMVICNL